MASSLKTITSVCMGCRFGGGVLMILRSLAPIKLNCKVRGMGVAVSVNESTVVLSCFNFSFAATPNFCSSSMIINAQVFKLYMLIEQSMCADDDINFSCQQLFPVFLFFLWPI